MYPIALDLSRISIALTGQGEPFTRRLTQLREAGATELCVYESIPSKDEILKSRILLVAGLDEETSAQLANIARTSGVLVNVEDRPALCDFYFMSLVRRGRLLLAASTGGASPTLSQQVKSFLNNAFSEEWAPLVEELATMRLDWKRQGLTNQQVGDNTRAWLASNALPPIVKAAA